MNFLYPAVLWALAVLVVPLIIHFFNFHRYQIMPFSNIQFIRMLQNEHRTRSRIRNLLLLILRMLALAFVIVAFAQPFIPNDNSKRSDNPRVAVYIDNSFSMEADGEYGVLLEWAKTRACELTNLFPEHTEYLLVTNNMSDYQRRWVSREQFADWVQKVQSTHLVIGIDEVMRRQQIIDTDTSRTLYSFIFSDLHKPAFTFGDVRPLPYQRVFLLPLRNAAQNNISIDSVWFSSPGLYVGKVEELTARIRNYGGEAVRNANIQIYVNDSLKNTASFSVDAQSVTDVKCSFMHSKQGWNAGKVSIQDFPITFDNQLFFSYNILPETKVLCLSEKQTTDYFAVLFGSDKAIGYVRSSPLNVAADRLSDYQTILLDAPALSSGLSEQLAAFAAEGGTLVLMPSENQKYTDLLRRTNGPQMTGWVGGNGMASNLNVRHSIFRDAIWGNQKHYTLPTYKGYFQVSANSRQSVDRLMDTESGGLLAFNYRYGKGVIYVFAVPFDPESTNLMLHPVFVPMFYNMAMQSSSAAQLYTTIRQPVQVPVRVSGAASVSISSAGGTLLYPGRRETSGGSVIYPDAAELSEGIWTVKSGDDFAGFLSFNYSRDESVQDYLSEDEVVAEFENRGFAVSAIENTNAEFAGNAAFADKHLWRLFVILALICFVMEAVVSRFKM